MLRPEIGSETAPLPLIARMVWCSMVSSLAILALVLREIDPPLDPARTAGGPADAFGAELAANLSTPLMIAAAVFSILVVFLRARLASGRGIGLKQPPSSLRKAIDSRATGSSSGLAEAKARETKLFPLFVIALGLSEAIAVLGFAQAAISKSQSDFYPFMLLSFLLMLSLFPNLSSWAKRGCSQ